jgi:anti-sigma-K factor RskA
VDIKEYISSGIVESYVLGLASGTECLEFEQLCLQYPELVAAKNGFEEKLEKKAFEHAVIPPAALREKVLTAISEDKSPGNKAKIITMDTKPKNNNFLRFGAAASVILLLASAWFAYDFYKKSKQLETEKKALEARLSSSDSTMNKMKEESEPVYGPNVTVVTLTATTPAAPSANIYWDTASSNVFLLVKNMPQLPSDKQYQLWSLLGGKPTSLGLFDGGQTKVMLKMNNAQKADAFAITIENRGNTGGPNLEQLQTMGKTDKSKL